MECKEVRSSFDAFLNKKLSIRRQREFLSHIGTCDSCMNEYKIYSSFTMAMRFMDDPQDMESYYFDPDEYMKAGIARLKLNTRLSRTKRVLFMVMLFGISYLLTLSSLIGG